MSWKVVRFDMDVKYEGGVPTEYLYPSADGDLVMAQDALDREAINTARIATLEAQLKLRKLSEDDRALLTDIAELVELPTDSTAHAAQEARNMGALVRRILQLLK